MTDWIPQFALIFTGGFLGGLCRYLISGLFSGRYGARFPMGTLVVNVTGAFLMGILWYLPWGSGDPAAELMRHLLLPGFLGGYTTVSSFSLNTLNLLQQGEWRLAFLNLFGTYFLCLGAVSAGSAVIHLWL